MVNYCRFLPISYLGGHYSRWGPEAPHLTRIHQILGGKSKLSNDHQFPLLQDSEPLYLKKGKTVVSASYLFHAFWFLITFHFTVYFIVKFIFLYFSLKWNSKLLETTDTRDLFCKSHNTRDPTEIMLLIPCFRCGNWE